MRNSKVEKNHSFYQASPSYMRNVPGTSEFKVAEHSFQEPMRDFR